MLKCPRCSKGMSRPFVALSRKDNKTEICPECGTAEALEAYVKYKEVRK